MHLTAKAPGLILWEGGSPSGRALCSVLLVLGKLPRPDVGQHTYVTSSYAARLV